MMMVAASISMTQSRQEPIAVTILVSSMSTMISMVSIAIPSMMTMMTIPMVTIIISVTKASVQVINFISRSEEGSKSCRSYFNL